MKNDTSEIISQILVALESIRPYLQADGGDIEFLELREDNVVVVRLLGSCYNCSLNFQTLKSGIEQTVVKAVPQIKSVIAIED